MKIQVILVLFVLYIIESSPKRIQSLQPELLYEWSFVNFTWRTQSDYLNYMKTDAFVNCAVAGVKISLDGDVFVTIPRWKPDVPSTLNKVVTIGGDTLLQPFPSWEMNAIGDPNAFQSVLGFEIDSKNRMWVLDQGKIVNDPAKEGSIKLVIIDLNSNNEILQTYIFPEDVAPLMGSFLNDVVVDMKHNFAYITDTGLGVDPLHGGLIVYDVNQNVAKRVLNQRNCTQPDPNVWLTINGEKFTADAPFQAAADGIALSPDTNRLYWCSLTGRTVYTIDTSLLRNFSLSDDYLEMNVKVALVKESASDGMACSNEAGDVLYMTGIETASLYRMQVNESITTEVQDTDSMPWPDTIGFDHQGGLVFTSNHLNKFFEGAMDFTTTNFRIWRIDIGANSYLDPVS